MNIKQKIVYGYALALGIALAGTVTGLLVGNHYQQKALQSRKVASQERKLLGTLQVDILYNRPAKQLSPHLQQPQRFRQESQQLIERIDRIESLLAAHNTSGKPSTIEGLQPLLDQYQMTVNRFAKKARDFSEKVQPLTSTEEGASLARNLLVDLVKSPEFVSFIEFPDQLSQFYLLAEQREEAAELDLEKAENLRTQIILLTLVGSIAISIILSLYISRSIAFPIQTLTQVAQQVTKESNFELQAKVNTKDEVLVLTNSLNQLIQRVRELLQQQKKYMNQLEQAKESADQANQSKSEFLANMSHELRTPLNGVLGYTQILARTAINEQQKRGLEIIFQCSSHLLTLINDILDLAKIEAQKLELYPTHCYLPSLLQGLAEVSRLKAEQKSLDFNYEPPHNLPSGIVVDEKRLRQVLLNLLSNAIKFTHRGNVTFQVTCPKVDKDFVTINFKIEDTGIGMSPQQLETIFLPFEQVCHPKYQNEGTGLGLTISQQIVEMMGSSLKVRSQENVGSVFEFEINCSQSTDWIQANTLTNLGQIVGYSGQRCKILVVDDRWENRSVLVNLLIPLGFMVEEASNGEEALEKAPQFVPDLIITDLKMPIMDGWEMLSQLHHIEALQNITVIVSSASVFAADRQKSLDVGADDFLSKPVQAQELYRMLANHLKIEWKYKELNGNIAKESSIVEEVDVILPSLSELNTLLEQAKQGQIKAIEKQLEQLSQKDTKYSPFMQEILPLVKGFKIQQVRQYLTKAIRQKQEQSFDSILTSTSNS